MKHRAAISRTTDGTKVFLAPCQIYKCKHYYKHDGLAGLANSNSNFVIASQGKMADAIGFLWNKDH